MKSSPTPRKLRGGYYTPAPIARFLADWAIKSRTGPILEPSCGDGNFLEAVVEALRGTGTPVGRIGRLIHAVEADKGEASKAAVRLGVLGIRGGRDRVLTSDFFDYCAETLDGNLRFQTVVGNPPFVRYQDFPEAQREPAFDVMEVAGLHPTRLTNAWVPFVVGSTLLLSSPGRLGMVLPAELLQVGYAAELRRFLIESYSRITLVTFRRLLFGGVQQEVVLFLGEKNGSEKMGIRTVEVDDATDLSNLRPDIINATPLKPVDHSTEKWTQYFLDADQIVLLRRMGRLPGLVRLGKLASVDVGVVTGYNDFFVLSESQVGERGVAEFVRPLVSRSSQLRGLTFRPEDWTGNAHAGLPVFLLDLPDGSPGRLEESARAYVAWGESIGAHAGYKCRIRDPWWSVPSVWNPSAFLLRQISYFPRMTANLTSATSTDTVHRVRVFEGIDPQRLAATMFNSLTFAYAEVIGRSYGGGVLELEPREAENLLVPSALLSHESSMTLDELVRAGAIDEALDLADRLTLREKVGLSRRQVETLREVWMRLRDRRSGRRQSNNEVYSIGKEGGVEGGRPRHATA